MMRERPNAHLWDSSLLCASKLGRCAFTFRDFNMACMKITPLVPLPLNNSTVKQIPKPIQHRDRSPVRTPAVRTNPPRLQPSKQWIMRVRYVR
ncbi:MAG: hypothetical protein RIS09_710 [Actinomycetota bacterium]